LRDYYNDLQALIGHKLATPTQISTYKPRLETTTRLIYFNKTIRGKFADRYAKDIQRAYKAINTPKPDYARLNRKASMDKINEFERNASGNSAPEVVKMLDLLVRGLKNLEKTYIPVNWI
jgi:hypothetical protein